MKKVEFINISDYFRKGIVFNFFVGGRGTGKTYSSLKYCIESGKKFIYMRRTLDELEECCDNPKYGEGENPFKKLNDDMDWNYGLVKLTKKTAGIYKREIDDNGKITHFGEPLGYGVALSTIATMRGIDLSDCDFLFYDEFITEKHVRKITAEGEAFLNAIETIARNREMLGKEPMIVVGCANAFNIYNPIFQELGLISQVEKMINRKQEHAYFDDRALSIHLLKNTDSFNSEKKETALYRLTRGTRFYDMALNNDFAYNDFSLIGYKKISGYRPICAFNDCFVYYKKGSEEFYITYSSARCVRFDVSKVQERKNFFDKYGKILRQHFVEGNVSFETYDIKMQFLDAIGLK